MADLDSVSLTGAGYTFTPYSGFTAVSLASQRFGPLVKLLVEVQTSTPRAAGQVNVGRWNLTTSVHGLGAGRISTANGVYEGTCQVAGNGEVRFYGSTPNATKFWGVVWMLLA